MVNVKYSELPLKTVKSASIVPFEAAVGEPDVGETGQSTAMDVADLGAGSATLTVTSEADLPPPVSGFIPISGRIRINFVERFTITNPFLLEAGAEILLDTPFGTGNVITADLTPGDTLFNTRNISGNINSFNDSDTEPGVKIKVSTSVAHGLPNGAFVNIFNVQTDPNTYERLGAEISNVTSTTFDIEGVVALADIADFDTGIVSFDNRVIFFDGTGFPGTLTAFDLEWAADPGFAAASFTLKSAIANFLNIGTIKPRFAVIENSSLTLNNSGLVITDAEVVRVAVTSVSSASPVGTGTAITVGGTNLVKMTVVDYVPNLSSVSEFPIRINGDIPTDAAVKIRDSGGSGIPTDYFDTSSGGLDQTDPRVIAKGNGTRADSMSKIQVGFTNIATPIVVVIDTQDVPIIIGGTQYLVDNAERATGDIAGQVTNLTKKTKNYPITFSGLIEKVGGGTTDIGILLIKNGSLTLLDTFEIPHSVNTGVIQISATRDFELAENDTLDIAVVNFDGISSISVSQANLSYSVES